MYDQPRSFWIECYYIFQNGKFLLRTWALWSTLNYISHSTCCPKVTRAKLRASCQPNQSLWTSQNCHVFRKLQIGWKNITCPSLFMCHISKNIQILAPGFLFILGVVFYRKQEWRLFSLQSPAKDLSTLKVYMLNLQDCKFTKL